MRGKIVHREPTRWMRTTTESVELGRRFDSRARLRRVLASADDVRARAQANAERPERRTQGIRERIPF